MIFKKTINLVRVWLSPRFSIDSEITVSNKKITTFEIVFATGCFHYDSTTYNFWISLGMGNSGLYLNKIWELIFKHYISEYGMHALQITFFDIL